MSQQGDELEEFWRRKAVLEQSVTYLTHMYKTIGGLSNAEALYFMVTIVSLLAFMISYSKVFLLFFLLGAAALAAYRRARAVPPERLLAAALASLANRGGSRRLSARAQRVYTVEGLEYSVLRRAWVDNAEARVCRLCRVSGSWEWGCDEDTIMIGGYVYRYSARLRPGTDACIFFLMPADRAPANPPVSSDVKEAVRRLARDSYDVFALRVKS